MCAQESLVHKREDGTILVPIQNYQGMAVHMAAGVLLGEARPLDANHGILTLDEAMCLPPSANDESVSASNRNAPVQAIFHTPDRIDQIVDASSLPITKLSSDQMTQLKSCILYTSDAADE